MIFLNRSIAALLLLYFANVAISQPPSGDRLTGMNETCCIFNCRHLPADFKVDFDVCNQYQVHFSNKSLDAAVVVWNFGDGRSGADGDTVSHIYDTEGVYKAMLVVQNNNGCLDTVYKNFLLSIDQGHIFTDKHLHVCKAIAFPMPGDSDAIENCWSPSLCLNSTSVYNPVCTPLNNAAYKYNIIVHGKNFIPNGYFDAGNLHFSSDYTYSAAVNTSGHYFVGPKPKMWNFMYQNCPVTSGSTNDSMLIVNGSIIPNTIVWETTMDVLPNTNYTFGFFAQPLTETDSLVLDVSINSGEIVGRMRLSKNPCNRKRFNTSWYSGASTSLNIKIMDLDTDHVNNNFALDTIALLPIYLKTDSIHVDLITPPVFKVTPTTTTICPGDSVLLTASGGDTYTWSPQTSIRQPFSFTTYVVPSSTTTYKAVIKENICNVTDSVFAAVKLSSTPRISITKSNDIDCANVQAELNASGGVRYNWSPSKTLSNADIPNPIATPRDTTVYHVKVTNVIGCSSEDSIQLLVSRDKNSNEYFVPNAFTPNNDGLNDCLGIRRWGNTKDLDFSIYNRWGSVVFSTRDFSKCWDGSYKGLPQPAGTYLYIIKANTLCGKIFRNGTVVLIR